MGISRNTVPANQARSNKADAHAKEVYTALMPLIDAKVSLKIMVYYLNNETDLLTPRGDVRWQRYQVLRILERVKDRHLYP